MRKCMSFCFGVFTLFFFVATAFGFDWSAKSAPKPEYFGIYVVDGGKLVELKEQKIDAVGNLFNVIIGVKKIPEITVRDKKAYIILYSTEIPYSSVRLSKLDYQKSGEVTNVVQKERVEVKMWVPKERIKLKVAPIKGETNMYRLVPVKPLTEGFYAVHFGNLGVGSGVDLTVIKKTVYGFVVGDRENLYDRIYGTRNLLETFQYIAKRVPDSKKKVDVYCRAATGLAKVGRFDHALKVAEGIGSKYWKGRALAEIASQLAEVGEKERAQYLLNHALKVVEGIGSKYWKGRALAEIASQLAEVGEKERAQCLLDHALKVAEGIRDEDQKTYVLVRITRHLAKAGRFDQVLKVAQEEFADDWALAKIAGQLAEAGRFDQALKVVKGIWDEDRKACALAEIAGRLAKAGEKERAWHLFDQALKVAEGLGIKGDKPVVLARIARQLAEVGEKERARHLLDQVLKVAQEEYVYDWALAKIAGQLAEAGRFDQALKVAEGIVNKGDKAWTLAKIAGQLAEAGRFDQALKVAEGIGSKDYKAWALEEIALQLTKAGRFDQALNEADLIKGPEWRSVTFLNITGEAMALDLPEAQEKKLARKIMAAFEQME